MMREYTVNVAGLLNTWATEAQHKELSLSEEMTFDLGLALVERLEALVEEIHLLRRGPWWSRMVRKILRVHGGGEW